MMSKLRENAKFFLWFTLGAFLFGFIAIMGFQAIGNKANNPEIVAKIDKENVTYTELAQSWRNQLQEMNSRGIKVSEEREKELKKEMLYDIIETKLKLNYAAKLGIMVSDEEVAESIMSIRAFLNKDGQFDKEQYTNYLYSQRIKPAEFEGQQRQYIMLVKLRNQLWSGIKYSQDELKSYFMKRQRSLNADYVYFNYKDYLKEIKITDDKLKDYYALHKKEYEKPERVKASHILIQADASPTSPTGLTDEAAKKLASDLLARLKAGEDFAALAKKYSADPGSRSKGGDLDWFSKGAMVPEFEKAAFALKKGGLSDVVKTQFGYHIIKVTGRDEGFSPTFDKVKDKVLAEIQKQQGMELARKRAEAFVSAAKSTAGFDAAAKGSTLNVRSTGFISEDSKNSGIDSQSYAETLFDLDKGQVSDIVNGENGYYVFRVRDEKPAKFDKAKFEKAAESLDEKLRNIKFESLNKSLLTKLKKESKIEVFENNLYL